MNSILVPFFLSITFFAFTECQFDEDSESRTFRLRPGDECEAEGEIGTCQRRSRCKRPTGKICRRGIIPIVCCLNEHTQEVPVTKPPRRVTTTTKTPTTIRPHKKTTIISLNNEEADIVFPGCGNRYPFANERSNQDNSKKEASDPISRGLSLFDGIGGFVGRTFGKRDVSELCKDKENSAFCEKGLFRKKRGLIQPVIVGGHEAKKNSWPWMVAIFKKTATGQSYLCGASLVSKRYVLSAAHCFPGRERFDPSKFIVLVGAHDTKQESGGKWYEVQSIVNHPEYQRGQYYNDMTLLKLSSEVELGSKVLPVCLPSPSLRNLIGNTKKNITVTGWGDTSFGGKPAVVLQEVEMPIVPLKECNQSYGKTAKAPFPRGINNLFICAGLKEGGKDACQGDSGGPLVMQMDNGDYVQLGIVSFGHGCANPGFPGVYTRVSKYSRWLHDNTDLGRK